MRPRSRRILALIALGIATTIAIAQSLSTLASHWSPDRVATGTDYMERPEWGEATFRTWSQHWHGVEVLAWKFKDRNSPYPEYRSQGVRKPESVYKPWSLPAWSSLHDEPLRRASEHLTTNITIFADWRAGWPLPALRGRLTPESLTDTQHIQLREGMLRFRDSTPRISIGDGLWLSGHLFPLIPVWPGFLADTALYTAAWCALLAGFTTLRRARRRRRNQCPACGYDLRATPAGSPCPECGTPAKAT